MSEIPWPRFYLNGQFGSAISLRNTIDWLQPDEGYKETHSLLGSARRNGLAESPSNKMSRLINLETYALRPASVNRGGRIPSLQSRHPVVQ